MLEQSGPALPDTIERRRSTREDRHVPAWLSDASGSSVASAQQQITVTNLSLHGVGFTAPKPVAKDDLHWIVINDGQLSLSTRLRVVSSRQNEDGNYEVGAEFF
jgi:hypothetical protein